MYICRLVHDHEFEIESNSDPDHYGPFYGICHETRTLLLYNVDHENPEHAPKVEALLQELDAKFLRMYK